MLSLAVLDPVMCLVYIDDIVVRSRSFKEHVKRLQMLFERICQAGLTLKVSKAVPAVILPRTHDQCQRHV